MKYVIVLLIFLAVSFFCGAVLAVTTTGEDWEQMMEDEEQREYLHKWNEKQKKRKRS